MLGVGRGECSQDAVTDEGDAVPGEMISDVPGGMRRHRDHPRLDFTRIKAEPDVHFAHLRGFVAKTSASDPQRLRQLLLLAAI